MAARQCGACVGRKAETRILAQQPRQSHLSSDRREHISRLIRLGLGFATGLAFVYLLLRNIELREVLMLVKQVSPAWLLAALVALTLDFVVRAFRFMLLLRAATQPQGLLTFRACIGPYIGSFCANNVLPLRAGDGFRLIWFSTQFRYSGGAVFGVMLVERALDLFVLMLVCAIALAFAPATEQTAMFITPLSYGAFATAACVTGLFVFPAPLERLTSRFTATSAWATGAANLVGSTSRAILMVRSSPKLLSLAGLSLVCWICECLVFVFTWLSMGGRSDLLIAPVLGFALGTLATLFPSLPGHFGPFDYFATEGFIIGGADRELATGVVLLTHFVLWAPTTLAGMCWLLTSPALRKSAKVPAAEDA